MTRLRLSAILLVAAGCLPLRASDVPSSAVEAAQKLAMNGRFRAAKASLSAIIASPGVSREDEDDATIELARIEWRIDDRPTAARERLDALIPKAKKRAKALLLLSRMERTLQRFDPARTAAREALDAADTPEDRDDATVALARALVEECLVARRTDRRSRPTEDEQARLTDAIHAIAPVVAGRPGAVGPAQVLLDAALLSEDGPRALAAFRSYFASAGTADSALVSAPRRTLEEILPRWNATRLDPAERLAIVRALAEARLFTEAVLVALGPSGSGAPAGGGRSRNRASRASFRGGGPPRPPVVPPSTAESPAPLTSEPFVRDLVSYEVFVRRARELTDRYYRDVARGAANARRWRNAFEAETRRIWARLHWDGKPPPFDEKLFDGSPDTELGKRFGLLLTGRGKTGGIEDLHAGHRVIDEKRTVEQYGHRASVRFIALDTMISNGYETWMWDGRGAHGGWGRVGFIVQVRPAYAGGGLRDWQEVTDPVRRAKFDERLVEETDRDAERAARDSYAYLPGLGLRLRRQGRLAILEALRAKGLSGDELRSAFVAATDRAVIESSIFAHEGRHAIDAEIDELANGATREYRAKLSEIAFAPAPRLAFGGIINETIANGTPHGEANSKLMKGLVGWMEAHRSEIADLEAARPLLPQLDKLTDDQLRAAARSLDPMAPRSGGEAPSPQPSPSGRTQLPGLKLPNRPSASSFGPAVK